MNSRPRAQDNGKPDHFDSNETSFGVFISHPSVSKMCVCVCVYMCICVYVCMCVCMNV